MKKIFGLYVLKTSELKALVRCITSVSYSPAIRREAGRVIEEFQHSEEINP